MGDRKKQLRKTKLCAAIRQRYGCKNSIHGSTLRACAGEVAIHLSLDPSVVNEVERLLMEMLNEGWIAYENGALVPLPVGADSKPLNGSSNRGAGSRRAGNRPPRLVRHRHAYA